MNELNYMGRINHQLGKRLILILISFLIIFALFVPPVSSLEAVIDDDCNIIQDVFDRDWKKYSNIDEQIPLDERKWPAKQYGVTQSKIVDAKLQIFFLRRDMEIDRLMRVELNEYKDALVHEHKVNLLKSFMRLSFLTVHVTVEAVIAGKSVGDSYNNIVAPPSHVSTAASSLKIWGALDTMAKDSKTPSLEDDTQDATEVVMGAGVNVALDAVESLGDPKTVGTAFVTQTIGAIPIKYKGKEWMLTEEDFEILEEAHLELKGIDMAWADSFEANLERLDKVRELEAQIKELEKELAKWEAEEKSRVKASLVDSCKDEKKEKCDSEHLSLCDNENDCEDAGGYWYNNNCNDEPEEEDTSDGEFNCPIPKEAKHRGGYKVDYWVMPNTAKKVGPSQEWYDIEKTKKLRFYCYNAEGKRHGVSKEWYEDGTPRYEWNYKDDKKHGVCKWWYEDGTLKEERHYKDGKRHGVSKKWYEDGTPIYEWNYKDGKLHGVCKAWYVHGTPRYERNYKDGKLHGVTKNWYGDGTLSSEYNYKDDKKHGVCKDWYENGTPRFECIYEEGKRVSCVHGRC